MSELYVKLFTSFFEHRKTAKLRSKIGDDAFWIPPRLWAYAAEHQIDGNFSGYSSEELAMLLGCYKHATSILQALTECGFIDSCGVIHDWQQHNGFHSTFSDRAKKAAKARWEADKKEKNQKKEDLDRETETEVSIASSMLEACNKHACSIDWTIEHGVELPEALRTAECLEAAKLWLQYKRERRQSYKPTGLRVAVGDWVKKYTAETFPEAVRFSVAQNWNGIYAPKDTNAGRNSGSYGPNGNPRNHGIAGFDEWERERQARAVGDGQDGPPA